jgi:hypothetical protein
MTYMKQVEEDGLTAVKEIHVKESQPFIFILKPQSQEITDEDVESVTELAVLAVGVFNGAGGKDYQYRFIDFVYKALLH